MERLRVPQIPFILPFLQKLIKVRLIHQRNYRLFDPNNEQAKREYQREHPFCLDPIPNSFLIKKRVNIVNSGSYHELAPHFLAADKRGSFLGTKVLEDVSERTG